MDPFVAEIRIVGFDFAPTGWALCDGQIMPISQNTALFSLLGTTYGGDGRSNFALPNLQGMAPMQSGQGPGLTLRDLGETGGEQNVTLLSSEMPAHSHIPVAASSGGQPGPGANTWGSALKGHGNLYAPASSLTPMSASSLSITGGSLAHNNMPPFVVMNYIIALQGVFPPRS